MQVQPTCSVEGCDDPVLYRGLCRADYRHYLKHDPSRPQCSVKDCARPHYARGLCVRDYQRWRTHGVTDDPPSPQQGCIIQDCDNPHQARGWCSKHYRNWKVHGRPVLPTYAEQFWARVERRGDDDCWPWMGWRDPRGYGRLGRPKRPAHRVAYTLAKGPIPPGRWVLHSCDNPPCCNPAHLRAGTYLDNERDKIERGRLKGERHPGAKLNADQVRAIRAQYVPFVVSQKVLADRYGVTTGTIGAILKGRLWSHL